MAVSTDDELSQLRDARRSQLQEQIEEQANTQLAAEEQAQLAATENSQLDSAMKVILSPEARSRLARLELAYPDLAHSVKQQLSHLHTNSSIAVPIEDETLRNILSGLQEQRRDTTIRRL
jgi:programmed cell death protein 5